MIVFQMLRHKCMLGTDVVVECHIWERFEVGSVGWRCRLSISKERANHDKILRRVKCFALAGESFVVLDAGGIRRREDYERALVGAKRLVGDVGIRDGSTRVEVEVA